MKTFATSLIIAIASVFSLIGAESNVIEFKIIGGGSSLSAATKTAMENNVVNLLTMMSEAQQRGSKALNFKGISITDAAKSSILQLWKYQPLKVESDDGVAPYVGENLLSLGNLHSYQVRNIPVRLYPVDTPDKSKYSEISINFSSNGTITDFNISIERSQYNKLIEEAHTVQDLENRKMLVYWMDQLKMAYESKDLNFLKSLFDQDAVIITGVRASQKAGKMAEFKQVETFDYFVKTREQYMSSMSKVFRNNKEINVNFKDQEYGYNATILVPDGQGSKMPRYYMVWCTQEWNATRYSDVGRLFLLWDFKNPEQPVILVRAWTHPDDPKQFSDEDFMLSTR